MHHTLASVDMVFRSFQDTKFGFWHRQSAKNHRSSSSTSRNRRFGTFRFYVFSFRLEIYPYPSKRALPKRRENGGGIETTASYYSIRVKRVWEKLDICMCVWFTPPPQNLHSSSRRADFAFGITIMMRHNVPYMHCIYTVFFLPQGEYITSHVMDFFFWKLKFVKDILLSWRERHCF